MNPRGRLRYAWLLLVGVLGTRSSFAQNEIVPRYKITQPLVASEDTSAKPYLAFPAIIEWDNEVLISFKRGRAHAADTDAVLDLLRIEPHTGRITHQALLASLPGQIMQMGEWVRFPNGDLANFIDTQQKTYPSRTGLRVVRSRDGGKTFSTPERVGAIDGIEYGYAFQAVNRGQSTWLVVMTFTNLSGGKPVFDTRSQPGSVDIIRSDDNGQSWHFVTSLTRQLGNVPINESSLAVLGDGYVLAARGYDKRQWLAIADHDFHITQQIDLAAVHPFIHGVLGRPRVFVRDGRTYLLARNTLTPVPGHPNPMRLSLFRLNNDSWQIDKHVLLDNSEAEDVTDGYYAMPYWTNRDGRSLLNVITYKRIAQAMPQIIRLEFDWSEVR